MGGEERNEGVENWRDRKGMGNRRGRKGKKERGGPPMSEVR